MLVCDAAQSAGPGAATGRGYPDPCGMEYFQKLVAAPRHEVQRLIDGDVDPAVGNQATPHGPGGAMPYPSMPGAWLPGYPGRGPHSSSLPMERDAFRRGAVAGATLPPGWLEHNDDPGSRVHSERALSAGPSRVSKFLCFQMKDESSLSGGRRMRIAAMPSSGAHCLNVPIFRTALFEHSPTSQSKVMSRR